jgi:AraC-like DNA-binding protein
MLGPATVRNDTLRHTLSYSAEVLGEPPERLARRARMPSLNGPGRTPLPALHRLWEQLTREERHPLPALVAGALPLDRLGPFGFAILTAPSGHAALSLAAKTFPLINAGVALELRDGPRKILRLRAPRPQSVGAAASEEAILSHFAVGLHSATGARARVLRFRHSAPNYARALAERLEIALEWDSEATELEIEAAQLDVSPRLANAETHQILRLHLEEELALLSAPRGLGERVRQAIEERLEARPIARQAAQAAGTSERTLRRRLAAEGTRFRQLRDGARRTQAEALLADPQRSITDVALELGFSDASSFARAYRRWHGESPAETRRRR